MASGSAASSSSIISGSPVKPGKPVHIVSTGMASCARRQRAELTWDVARALTTIHDVSAAHRILHAEAESTAHLSFVAGDFDAWRFVMLGAPYTASVPHIASQWEHHKLRPQNRYAMRAVGRSRSSPNRRRFKCTGSTVFCVSTRLRIPHA
eukprot:2626499-Rhodomonas_salina.5